MIPSLIQPHRTLSALALLLALTLPMPAQNTPSSPPQNAREMRDRYRPLLLFAPPGDPKLTEQMHLLTAQRTDLVDRQILLVPAFHNYAGIVDSEIMTLMGSEEPVLRKRFHIRLDEFTVILLGKDGGEKIRSHTPITIDQLNQFIDAMPMRQQEMKSRPPH